MIAAKRDLFCPTQIRIKQPNEGVCERESKQHLVKIDLTGQTRNGLSNLISSPLLRCRRVQPDQP